MSIAVSVLTTSRVARNNGGAARQTNGQREFSGAKATRNPQLNIAQFVMVHKAPEQFNTRDRKQLVF